MDEIAPDCLATQLAALIDQVSIDYASRKSDVMPSGGGLAQAILAAGWQPPPPDSETRTDWGFEITSEGVTSVCRSVSEEAARGELKFFEKLDPRVMQRTVITGPWIEAA